MAHFEHHQLGPGPFDFFVCDFFQSACINELDQIQSIVLIGIPQLLLGSPAVLVKGISVLWQHLRFADCDALSVFEDVSYSF